MKLYNRTIGVHQELHLQVQVLFCSKQNSVYASASTSAVLFQAKFSLKSKYVVMDSPFKLAKTLEKDLKFTFLVKPENLLLTNNGKLKLCDFGSATTQSYYPKSSWTALQRTKVIHTFYF